jgi:hypothetical protein
MVIVENTILQLLDIDLKQESLQRVLWVSPNQEYVVVVDITNSKKMKYPFFRKYEDIVNEAQDGHLRKVEFEPDLRLLSPDEKYLKEHKAKRDKKWDVIKDIVKKEPDIYISDKRGPLITMTKEKTGKSKKVIYDHLKKYWFYGKSINGLLDNYFDCGAPGKPKVFKKKPGPKSQDGNNYIVTEKDKEIFEKAIKRFHKKEGMSIEDTHTQMLGEWYSPKSERKHGVLVQILEPENSPTLRQFRYWYTNKYSKYDRYSNIEGKRKAEMNVRPLVGNAEERALGVGSLFETDSTPADILLVAEDRKKTLGSPTLYLVKDVFSRMIAGFNVTLSNPSAIEQMVALENAATNKVEFCARYNIKIEESEWPCAHLPRMIAGDRGELRAKMSENLVNINVDVANAPSYRGDLKPFVEQDFRITNKTIREVFGNSGAKPPKLIERGDKDPARKATLTIYEFTQFMIYYILAYNNKALNEEYVVTKEMSEDKVELTPIGVWNWGKGKKLLHEQPRDLLRFNLLPKEGATVTRSGVKWQGMRYTSKLAIEKGWFVEKHIDGEKEITISYDPRNVGSIFIRLKNGKLEQCFLTDKYKEYDGLHLEDLKTIRKYKKDEINKNEKKEKQNKVELHALSKNIANNAKKETKNATEGMSHYERNKDKRETRKAEARARGSEDAWTAVKNSDSVETLEQTAEVLEFPTKSQSNNLMEEQSEIQKRFSAKINNRRRNRESLE